MFSEITVNDYYVHKKTNELMYVTKLKFDTRFKAWSALVATEHEFLFRVVAIQNLESSDNYQSAWL